MIYTGTLNTRSKEMSPLVRRAQGIFNAQRQRCTNPKSNSFEHYGSKGIRVEYSAREFIGWYLHNIKTKKLSRPTVGRIDHSKNYCFENIELIEWRDNAIESLDRNGHGMKSRAVVIWNDSECHVFGSGKSAAKHFGVTNSLIALRKRKPHKAADKFPYRVSDFDSFGG